MSGAHTDTSKMKGILTDVTKCIGCELCVEACVQVNKLPPELPARANYGDGLSGRRYTSILKVPGTEKSVRKHCLHCLDPSCASACLVGAFTKQPDGPVVYDARKCIGCRYCMLACPFMIPRYEWDQLAPYIRKCKMNEDCRMPGGMPACVSACPTGATIFGIRQMLIEEADRRIGENPDLYLDHIYGEHEFGGTSVIYITSKDAPLNMLGFPKDKKLEQLAVAMLKKNSIPSLTWPTVKLTPIIAGTVFTGLWIIERRQRLAAKKGPHDRGTHGAPEPETAGIDEICHVDPGDKEGE